MKSFNVIVPWVGSVPETHRIKTWEVEKGDRITRGQVICELESENTVVELESKYTGKVKALLSGEGDRVFPGNQLAIIKEEEA